MKIGSKFRLTKAKPWFVEGNHGEEIEEMLCEVTNLSQSLLEYRVIQRVSVSDPNPMGASETSGGGIALSAVNHYLKIGSLQWCS